MSNWHDRTSRALESWDPTQDPADAERPSAGATYRCVDCDWHGKALGAFDHHRNHSHHRITVGGRLAHFGCCTDISERRST